MTIRPLFVAGACLFALLSGRASAQPTGPVLAVAADTSQRQLIKLRDGSTVLGRIVQSWGDSARVESLAGTFVVRRANVASIQVVMASSLHEGVYWPEDPNATRLFFGPTARMLKKGEGYIANHWILLMDGYVGISDRVSIGGAMTLFPTGNLLKDNLYFLSPKVAITQSERFNTAAGVMIGGAPFNDEIEGDFTFGIAYGVATWGGANGAFTLGGGYGFAEGKMARSPMVMVGGTRRLSKRWSFVSENWVFPNLEDRPLASAGFRTIGDNVSWDLGFVTVLGTGESTILVPWLGASWKF